MRGGSGPLFHGGCPHLRPGQLVQPPVLTGAPVAPVDHKRVDLTYVCQDRAVAGYFARLSTVGAGAAWQSASVYEVEPLGDLEPDPYSDDDLDGLHAVELVLWERAGRRGPAPTRRAGLSFGVPAARVLRVVRTNLRMRPAEVQAHHEVGARNGWTWSYDRVAV